MKKYRIVLLGNNQEMIKNAAGNATILHGFEFPALNVFSAREVLRELIRGCGMQCRAASAEMLTIVGHNYCAFEVEEIGKVLTVSDFAEAFSG